MGSCGIRGTASIQNTAKGLWRLKFTRYAQRTMLCTKAEPKGGLSNQRSRLSLGFRAVPLTLDFQTEPSGSTRVLRWKVGSLFEGYLATYL